MKTMGRKLWIKGQQSFSVLKNERGESRGVGAMVGVMIAVGIAVIIWGLVSGWLPTFWSKITGKADTIG